MTSAESVARQAINALRYAGQDHTADTLQRQLDAAPEPGPCGCPESAAPPPPQGHPMPDRKPAPFYLSQSPSRRRWGLWMRQPIRFIGWFDTQAEAIDHAHKNWPWLP